MLVSSMAWALTTNAENRRRVWIDSDAACTGERLKDPDDCLAIFALTRTAQVDIAGVSSVFGNADLERTHGVLLDLARRLRSEGYTLPDPVRGASEKRSRKSSRSPAVEALCQSLGPPRLTVLALGPLTNLAGTLTACPQQLPHIEEIVVVGGRRSGHVFHPAEDQRRAARLGHGPVFRDLNIALDKGSAKLVIESGVAITLTPYELARQVEVTTSDLAALSALGSTGAWLAQQSRPWLQFWHSEAGRKGFYPFDLLAVVAVVRPQALICQSRSVAVARDREIGWFGGPTSLLLDPDVSHQVYPARVCLEVRNVKEVLSLLTHVP